MQSDKVVFIQELSLYLVCSLCSVNVSVVFVYVYLNIFVHYHMNSDSNYSFEIDIPNYVMAAFSMFTFVATLINQKVRWHHRNFIIRGSPENPVVLYLLCLPLLAISMVCLIYILVYTALCHHISQPIVIFSTMLTYVAMIMVLVNQNGSIDTGESWTLSFSNFTTILCSLVVLFMTGAYHLTMLQLYHFLDTKSFYSNISIYSTCTQRMTSSSIGNFLQETFTMYIEWMRTLQLLLSLVFTPYLILPLQRNRATLANHLRNTASQMLTTEGKRHHSRITDYDILASILLTIVFTLPMVINLCFHKVVNDRTIHAMSVVQLLMMMGGVLYLLRDVSYWRCIPRRSHSSIYNQVVMWLGTLGTQSNIMMHICALIIWLDNEHVRLIAINLTVRMAVDFLEVFLQTILISFIIGRKFMNIKKETPKILKVLNPFFYLAILNILLLVRSSLWIMFKTHDIYNHPWQNSLVGAITAMSTPFAFLYRFFCILVLLRTTFHR